jgi:hypothetical protein
VYRHCLFCHADLRDNREIEHFPVGRKLAFDGEKGRLWAICRSCARWNLTPLEERWEAIEECERRFRHTSRRMSSENIGLARLAEGLELVRIGRPHRPEFAAWRYGEQFVRRRRRFYLMGASGVVAFGGSAMIGVSGAAAGVLPYFAVQWGMDAIAFTRKRLVRLRALDSDGGMHPLRWIDVRTARLRAAPHEPDGWDLTFLRNRGLLRFAGPEALRVLRTLLPGVNQAGGSHLDVQHAVTLIESARTSHDFLRQEHALEPNRFGKTIAQLPTEVSLALEMATNEETERRAIEGELTQLEHAWKEAEELAAIADDLTLPDRVRHGFAALRAHRDHG